MLGTKTQLEKRNSLRRGLAPCGFDAGDGDLYRYVGNEPTNAADPSGLDAGATLGKPVRVGTFPDPSHPPPVLPPVPGMYEVSYWWNLPHHIPPELWIGGHAPVPDLTSGNWKLYISPLETTVVQEKPGGAQFIFTFNPEMPGVEHGHIRFYGGLQYIYKPPVSGVIPYPLETKPTPMGDPYSKIYEQIYPPQPVMPKAP